MKKKDGLPYKTAHALSLVIIGIFAVPAVICFAVLWGVLGITDKLLDKLGGEGSLLCICIELRRIIIGV